MKLDLLTVENFRQYYGKQRLSFAKDKEKRVTVIEGVNGAGKTSLFLALNWCLYGKIADDIRVIDNVGELISKEAFRQATPGETIRTAVELKFHHDGAWYIARRSLEVVKQQEGNSKLSDQETFFLNQIGRDGQTRVIKNPIGTMNAILPVNVREYFLFDGEKIDNFAKPDASDQVKKAIYLVLKLEILDRARRHLDELAKEYRKELKQTSSGELQTLIAQDETLRSDQHRLKQQKEELQRNVDSAKRKITEIDQRLGELQSAKPLQQQREQFERQLKELAAERENTLERIQTLTTSGYFALANPFVQKALELLNTKRQRGEIPSNIRQQFIQDLIGQMSCICGRPVLDGSPEHQKLLGLLKNSLPSSLENDVIDTTAALSSFSERKDTLHHDLEAELKRRAHLVEMINNLDAELDDITRRLKGAPLEEISQLEVQRQNFKADAESGVVRVTQLHMQIESLQKQIVQLEHQITKARKDQTQDRILAKKLELAQKSTDAITYVYQTFADSMRERIRDRTKEIFKRLVWKESHFQDIQLDSDYKLEVIDRYGFTARPELSAGERQVLSLSFIAAMANVNDEEAPLVMDTPFGRLSSHHRNSITKELPELAPQLVLFVTDEELREQARANIEPWIGAEYRLEFNPNTSCTEIRER